MNIYLAPLHGITYYHFRNCFYKHFQGIDCAIAPFIAAQPKDKLNPKKFPDLFPENNKGHRSVIPQIMGNKPNDIKETVLVLHETFGYPQFNWNIGCPVNNIVRKQRGCGIMPFADLIEKTVNEVCGKTSVRFSLKMRLGLKSHEEGWAILPRLAPYPIDFLCIHPRLGIQQYEGNVDLDVFELFYQTTNHKIVYSGDIHNVDSYMKLQKRFPKIEDWMLGRGILQNPFLAETLRATPIQKTPTPQRFIDFYNEYAEILCMLKGEKIALSSLKELWHYFAVFWKLDTMELQQLLRINDYQKFNETTSFIFSQNKI